MLEKIKPGGVTFINNTTVLLNDEDETLHKEYESYIYLLGMENSSDPEEQDIKGRLMYEAIKQMLTFADRKSRTCIAIQLLCDEKIHIIRKMMECLLTKTKKNIKN